MHLNSEAWCMIFGRSLFDVWPDWIPLFHPNWITSSLAKWVILQFEKTDVWQYSFSMTPSLFMSPWAGLRLWACLDEFIWDEVFWAFKGISWSVVFGWLENTSGYRDVVCFSTLSEKRRSSTNKKVFKVAPQVLCSYVRCAVDWRCLHNSRRPHPILLHLTEHASRPYRLITPRVAASFANDREVLQSFKAWEVQGFDDVIVWAKGIKALPRLQTVHIGLHLQDLQRHQGHWTGCISSCRNWNDSSSSWRLYTVWLAFIHQV